MFIFFYLLPICCHKMAVCIGEENVYNKKYLKEIKVITYRDINMSDYLNMQYSCTLKNYWDVKYNSHWWVGDNDAENIILIQRGRLKSYVPLLSFTLFCIIMWSSFIVFFFFLWRMVGFPALNCSSWVTKIHEGDLHHKVVDNEILDSWSHHFLGGW